MKKEERIQGFVEEIWQWFSSHKRILPWRDLNESCREHCIYKVLVSEIMLQQTQVERVKNVYKEFLSMFPKSTDLASASNADVLLVWRGMGYNNRALRLRDAAKNISLQQEVSIEMKDLKALPGVGHYTAAAIRNFACNIPTPCLDTNIRRILHRTFIGPEHADGTWKKSDGYLLKLAEEVMEIALDSKRQIANSGLQRDAANWHAALMDFGSLVCTARNPKWDVCPLTTKGLCKSSYKVPSVISSTKKKEPGRYVGSTYVPNRIFRGKIIEQLRNAPKGLDLESLGEEVCIDWSEVEHTEWLEGLLLGLIKDRLIMQKCNVFSLYN